MDQDTQAVIERLNEALAKSGLSLRQFAHALGTSPSRFSAYRSGQTAPSAAFLLRAQRIADALSQARRDRIPSSIDAIETLRRAAKRGDEDWTYALTLEIRDRIRAILLSHKELAPAWEAQPPPVEARWKALAAAFVSREFNEAGLTAPKWTATERLDSEWVLDTPRLTEAEIKQQTPAWLAERNIFIAAKDLVTA
jgi:transcriptional regulator with XRE-family HTH domain